MTQTVMYIASQVSIYMFSKWHQIWCACALHNEWNDPNSVCSLDSKLGSYFYFQPVNAIECCEHAVLRYTFLLGQKDCCFNEERHHQILWLIAVFPQSEMYIIPIPCTLFVPGCSNECFFFCSVKIDISRSPIIRKMLFNMAILLVTV